MLTLLTFVQDVKQTFYAKWHHMVSQGQEQVYKWRREHGNLRPEDVVLMKNETTVSKMYCLAQVYKCNVYGQNWGRENHEKGIE